MALLGKFYCIKNAALCFAACTALAVSSASAGPGHNEDDGDDAGNTLGSATDLTGLGQTTLIFGSLGGSDRQDFFKVKVENPGNWGFGLTTAFPFLGDLQTSIWLFNAEGVGVLGNNISPDPNFDSLLVPSLSEDAVFSLAAGEYYLAITERGDNPQNVFGNIFNFASDDEVSGPDGAGGELPFEFWTNNSVDVTAGTYRIDVQEYPIPGPSTLALLGLAGLIGRRRRRG